MAWLCECLHRTLGDENDDVSVGGEWLAVVALGVPDSNRIRRGDALSIVGNEGGNGSRGGGGGGGGSLAKWCVPEQCLMMVAVHTTNAIDKIEWTAASLQWAIENHGLESQLLPVIVSLSGCHCCRCINCKRCGSWSRSVRFASKAVSHPSTPCPSATEAKEQQTESTPNYFSSSPPMAKVMVPCPQYILVWVDLPKSFP